MTTESVIGAQIKPEKNQRIIVCVCVFAFAWVIPGLDGGSEDEPFGGEYEHL